MKSLLVEDEFIARMVMNEFLNKFSHCDIAVDGNEAIHAFELAWKNTQPYDLICLDIIMPNMNGLDVLKHIRDFEAKKGIAVENGAKIIMTTSLDDVDSVMGAFNEGCEAYMIKPVSP